MNTSPLFKLINPALDVYYFCDVIRCGSNFFQWDEVRHEWQCNACLTPPVILPGAEFHSIPNEPEAVTTHDVKLPY